MTFTKGAVSATASDLRILLLGKKVRVFASSAASTRACWTSNLVIVTAR